MTPKETAETFLATHGLTIAATFVPWSQSCNYQAGATVDKRSLNWKVTLLHNGRSILTTDYSAGIAHCPAYKAHKPGTLRWSRYNEKAYIYETEIGQVYRRGFPMGNKTPILPDPCDVLYSLIMDADILNAGTFESWASDYGYDTDSRKAKDTYDACLGIALQLLSGLGASVIESARQALEDY